MYPATAATVRCRKRFQRETLKAADMFLRSGVMERTPWVTFTTTKGNAVKATVSTGAFGSIPNHMVVRKAHTKAGNASSTSTVSLMSARAITELPMSTPTRRPLVNPIASPNEKRASVLPKCPQNSPVTMPPCDPPVVSV